MLVKEIMSKKPDFLSPNATLKEAANEMLKYDFGFIPVGENDRLIGVVTDRDIAIRAIATGKDPNHTYLKDMMTDKVIYCFEDDDVIKAADNMSKLQIHRLVVLDKNKRMTGIVSLGDLAKHCKDEKLCGHVVHCISEELH